MRSKTSWTRVVILSNITSAGTKVKNLFSRMIAGEKSAKNLLDASLKLNNIKFDALTGTLSQAGETLSFEGLSKLAEKDALKALEILSKLTVEGKLSTEVLQKMFTARHFPEIASLLTQINGDVDGFVEKMSKGVSYTDDFYKSMFDVNNQWKIFKNNVSLALEPLAKDVGETALGLGLMARELANFSSTVPALSAVSGGLGGIALQGLGVHLAMSKVWDIMKVAFSVKFNPVILGLTGVLMVVGAIAKEFGEQKKEVADLNIALDKFISLSGEMSRGFDTANMSAEELERIMSEMGTDESLKRNLEGSSTVLGMMISQASNLRLLLSSFADLKPVGSMVDTSAIKNELGSLETSSSNTLRRMYEKVPEFAEKSLQNAKTKGFNEFDMFSNVSDKDRVANVKKMAGDYVEHQKKMKEEIAKAQKLDPNFDPIKKQSELEAQFGKGYGFSERETRMIMSGMNSAYKDVFSNDLEMIDSHAKQREELQKKLSAQIEENNKIKQSKEAYYNNLVGLINSERLAEFKNTGHLSVNGNNFYGLEALLQEEMNEAQKGFSKTLGDIGGKKNQLSVELQLLPVGSVEHEKKQKEIEGLIKAEADLTNEVKKSLNVEKLRSEFKSIASNKITGDIVDAYAQLIELNKQRDKYLKDGTVVEGDATDQKNLELQSAIKRKIFSLDAIEQEKLNKNKGSKTTQQIRYNSYLKENLDLELALLQVGKSKAMQDQMAYEYQLKQLQANKRLLTESHGELATSKQTLAMTGFDTSQITSAEQGQQLLKSFYETHVGTLTGEAGGKLKDMYTAMQKYVASLQKVEDITEKELLLSVKKYSDIVESIPSIWQDVYSAMQGASDLGLISPMNIDDLSQSSAMKELKDELKRLNNDFGIGVRIDGLVDEDGGEVDLSKYLTKTLGKEVVFTSPIGESPEITRYLTEALREEMIKLETMAGNTNFKDEESVKQLNSQKLIVEALVKANKNLLSIEEKRLENQMKTLDTYNQMGSVMSSFGSIIGSQGLQDFGDIFTGFGDLMKHKADPSKKFSSSQMFDFKSFNTKEFADNFGKGMESAMKSMDLGASIGTAIGSVTGGGQSAQVAGALGGLGAGLAGVSSPVAMAISAGMSLIGGLFEDDGSGQVEADKRSAEQKKIYDKNTDALQKLANNMSSLGSGIDGLNNSLINSFSKIPTFGKLTDITGTLKQMYSTMEATRKFESVAYQYTKTKKGSSGFLGIGAKPGTSEIKTVEFSVQEMLNKYGFKGTIEDMSTDQMRGFSKWLEDFDMGESDNFSILADSIEEYAEALDQFDKNIDKFFYDATMEGFSGISSIQQDELRQQLEDFYKNLGFQIDDAMRKTIDEMAESMSIMVSIMGDVRGEFINTWKESGKNAGDAFLSSMKPYIDAMLENMSQVFYDVYLSDVTASLEKEFKAISERLVELKKQGSNMKFEDLANSLSGSFATVVANIKMAQSETANFNDLLLMLQQEAFESGLTLSEMIELGLATGTQKAVVDSFKDALLSSDAEGAFKSIGDLVGDKVGNALADKMLDNLMSDRILEFSANLDKIVSGSTAMTFDSLALLAQESLSVGLMLDSEQRRLSAITDMFDYTKDINYQNDDSTIQYSSGTSSQNVYNYYISSSVEASNVVESDSIRQLAVDLVDDLIEVMRDKGINVQQ